MEDRAVYYANGMVEAQDSQTPHHLVIGGHPALVAEHCELVDRVAKLEERIAKYEMYLARLYGHVVDHVYRELPQEDKPQ